MKTLSFMLCLTVVCAVALSGCRKKPKENTEASKPKSSVSLSELGRDAMDKAAEGSDKAVEAVAKVLDIAQQFQADQSSSLPEISARAKEMAAENLRKMAEKYRDVIAANQQKLKELTEKFIAIPVLEKNSPEADTLKATIDQIYQGLDPLKQRFEVYYNALKEKAGNLKGLEL
ncbi:MAG: hypothetical protein IH624_17415 [Phycisphaerae bacterium]|nr:hypothetical protein [Phycisphaerae bacterium]